jgi:hypothetical protein
MNDQGSDLQEEKVGSETSKPGAALEAKERVSFGTNVILDGESSEGNSVVKTELELATTVERFHARKFGANLGKRGVLKVNSAGTSKKQNTPIKTSTQGALLQLSKDIMVGRSQTHRALR